MNTASLSTTIGLLIFSMPLLATITGKVSLRASGLLIMLWCWLIAAVLVIGAFVVAPGLMTTGFLSRGLNAVVVIVVFLVVGFAILFAVKATRLSGSISERGEARGETNQQLNRGIGTFIVLCCVTAVVLHVVLPNVLSGELIHKTLGEAVENFFLPR